MFSYRSPFLHYKTHRRKKSSIVTVDFYTCTRYNSNMQYKPKHFSIKELVAPSLLKAVPEWKLWLIFDPELLKCADLIRQKYGKCTVNADGLTDCGLRDFNSDTGTSVSAHKFGRGLDLHISTIESKAAKIKNATDRKKWKTAEYEKVRKELMEDSRFDSLNFEVNISWLHIDTFNRPNRKVNP